MKPLYVILGNRVVTIDLYTIDRGIVRDASTGQDYPLQHCYEDLAEVCTELLDQIIDLNQSLDSVTDRLYWLDVRVSRLERER